jgi:7,8-dihydropterin-6-yl-methyl-4-(beta-D-ribofuranosyl)aminobenzene 5'-phosphate synthase
MKVTVLIENTVDEKSAPVKPEHGICLYIEHAGKKILFDTGASTLFSKNAEAMNIDLSCVDCLVLSHAHFDHAGGLERFLEINRTAPVVLLEKASRMCYAKFLFFYKYIGINHSLFKKHPDRFRFFNDIMEIVPGVTVISNNVHNEHKPLGNNILYIRENGSYIKDPFDHELIMVLDESDGSTVFTGCSHNGILNMLASVYRTLPGKKVKAIIGGFHLMNPITKKMVEGEETVAAIAAKLRSLPIGSIYTGHCTGLQAYRLMKNILGDTIAEFKTGMTITM